MGFIQDIFHRVPGGTTFGNMIRNIANKASNGFLGNGRDMISQEAYDLKYLTDKEFEAKYAKTKTGILLKGITPNPNIMTAEQRALMLSANVASNSDKKTFLDLLRRYWYLALIPFGLTSYFVYRVIKKLIKYGI